MQSLDTNIEESAGGPQENSWASLSFTGFVGSITAFNDRDMAIGEIGVSFPDDRYIHYSIS